MYTDWINEVLTTKGNKDQTWKDKYKYCASKNQLVITVGRSLLGNSSFIDNQPHAYPPIIANLHGLDKIKQQAMCFLLAYGDELQFFSQYFNNDDTLKNEIKKKLEDDEVKVLDEITSSSSLLSRQYPCAGVSLATIFANPISGDSVGSVMIGGLVTIQNGPCNVS